MEICPYRFNLSSKINTNNNNFCVFKSIENIYYLVYTNKFDIISYNLNDMKIQNKININYNENLGFYHHIIGHFFDKKNKRDLILISTYLRMLIFNFNTMECMFSHKNYRTVGCLFFDKNKTFIYTQEYSSNNWEDTFTDLKEKKVKKFPSITAYFSDSYYDDNKGESFIIVGTEKSLKSYIYCLDNIKVYHEFSDGTEIRHNFAMIKKEKEIAKLFDGSDDGYIRIWNFHTGELLNKILICKNFRVFCFDFLDDKYIICGTSKNIIEVFDIETKKFIKKLEGYFQNPYCIKAINITNDVQYLFAYSGTYKEIEILKISKKDN